MTIANRFLTEKYGAYHYRDVPPEDSELTHVGPGTPGGEYFRRFWLPVALSDELKDVPLRVRILGEDLVVFRDFSGNVGVLQPFCSHRGTSLEFGLVSERGLRCCYHGWLYDVDGTILETPGEPADSTLKDRLCHGAYPAYEYKGMVFAYMGPPDKMPSFPRYDMLDFPEYPVVLRVKNFLPCNWLQIKENAMDPVHLYFLHTIISGAQFTEELGQVPQMEFVDSPLGMIYIDTRRLGDHVWVRLADYIAPTTHQFPGNSSRERQPGIITRTSNTVWAVPVDDTHTMNIRIRRFREGDRIPEDPEEQQGFAQTSNRPLRERQMKPGDYEARVSIYDGLAVHDREHLAVTDRGVIMLRNIVRQGIQAVQQGKDPKGVFRGSEDIVHTYAHQRMVPVPPASSEEADNELLRDTGRRVAEEVMKDPARLASDAS